MYMEVLEEVDKTRKTRVSKGERDSTSACVLLQVPKDSCPQSFRREEHTDWARLPYDGWVAAVGSRDPGAAGHLDVEAVGTLGVPDFARDVVLEPR